MRVDEMVQKWWVGDPETNCRERQQSEPVAEVRQHNESSVRDLMLTPNRRAK